MERLDRAHEEEDWPACILRWETLLATEPKPMARAKLRTSMPEPARPSVASSSAGLPLAAKGRTARAAAALRCNAKPRKQPFELELTVTEASFRIRIP